MSHITHQAKINVEGFLAMIVSLAPSITVAEAASVLRQVEGLITVQQVETPLAEYVITLPDAVQAMSDGRKIAAIKVLRDATKCTLVEAKNAVDKVYNDYAPRPQWETDLLDSYAETEPEQQVSVGWCEATGQAKRDCSFCSGF